MKFINEIKKMYFSSNKNEFFEFYDKTKRNQNKFEQNSSNLRLNKINERYQNFDVFEIHKL